MAPGRPLALPGLALQGGGFRAQSTNAGLLAGLMAFLAPRHPAPSPPRTPTLESTRLLARFAIVSSNSGSSWFFASLAYSPPYKQLLERIAAAPFRASDLHNAGYTAKFLSATNGSGVNFRWAERVARLASGLLGRGGEDTIYLLTYFLATGFSWKHFVDVLLHSTASISTGVALGAPPSGEWAQGKAWLLCHSVLTPSSRYATIYQASLGFPRVSYKARAASPSFPDLVAAAFSVRLGGGVESDAPVRYVAGSAVGGVSALEYSGVRFPLLDEHRAFDRNVSLSLGPSAFRAHSGMLPLTRVVAASSAFLGHTALLGPFVKELQVLSPLPHLAASALHPISTSSPPPPTPLRVSKGTCLGGPDALDLIQAGRAELRGGEQARG